MKFRIFLHLLILLILINSFLIDANQTTTTNEEICDDLKCRNFTLPYNKTIVGERFTFNGTKKGVAFLGIPFAEPPVGNLRFKPPEPKNISSWPEIFYANISANSCAADIYESNFTGYSFWNPTNEVSEDCLQLNMWIPSKRDNVNNKGYCVIVYIYGGAFFSGSASLDVYNGSILAVMSRCIVVNLNYRLGVLGFAYLNDSVTIPGNMGLLDQQMGMKWVYDNVEYFGGNKSNITIFGESAGSVSVISHLYANESHQYFKRIIANSGTVQNVWGRASNNYAHNKTLRFAKKLNCVKNFTSDKNYTKILLCLQNPNITTKNITDIGGGIQNNSTRVFEFVFEPIENDTVFFKGNLSEKIYKNELKRDVDIFIGKTSDEFTYFMPYYFYGSDYNCSYNESLPRESEENSCNINETGYKNIFDRVGRELRFPGNLSTNLSIIYNETFPNETYRYKASRFLAEAYFDCDIYNWTMKFRNVTEGLIYFYEFVVVSSSNPWPKWMGAMHGYELEYEFGLPFRNDSIYNETLRESEKNFSSNFMNLLGSFAEKGWLNSFWKNFSGDPPPSNILKIQPNYTYVENNEHIYTNTCKILQPYLEHKLVKRCNKDNIC